MYTHIYVTITVKGKRARTEMEQVCEKHRRDWKEEREWGK